MWHVAFGKHLLISGIFDCLVVFKPLFLAGSAKQDSPAPGEGLKVTQQG